MGVCILITTLFNSLYDRSAQASLKGADIEVV